MALLIAGDLSKTSAAQYDSATQLEYVKYQDAISKRLAAVAIALIASISLIAVFSISSYYMVPLLGPEVIGAIGVLGIVTGIAISMIALGAYNTIEPRHS